jgi:hypothetical protein
MVACECLHGTGPYLDLQVGAEWFYLFTRTHHFTVFFLCFKMAVVEQNKKRLFNK